MDNLEKILTVSESLTVLKTLRMEDGGEKGRFLQGVAERLENVYCDLLRVEREKDAPNCVDDSDQVPEYKQGKIDLPDFSNNLPVCTIELHSLDENLSDTGILNLLMHAYPTAKPEYCGNHLVMDKNGDYHIAWWGKACTGEYTFIDPDNDYLPYISDYIIGWLRIV